MHGLPASILWYPQRVGVVVKISFRSNTTLQGVDYTKTKSPMDYADVWTVQNIQLSCKCESVRDQH